MSPEPRAEERTPDPPRWRVVAAAGLPGLLLGIHLAGLLFFLNPSMPFGFGPVARVALVFGTLFSILGLLVQLPRVFRRPRRVLRTLPWMLTTVFLLAAAMDFFHASYFAFYLPTGINRRLVKAALWLLLAALIGFYTALLHSYRRRPYGLRSRLAFAVLIVGSIYAVVARRGAFHPTTEVFRPSSTQATQRPHLLVVGVETATLDALLPLAGQGGLPFFSEALGGGAYGRLESFKPGRSLPLWTTLATGKWPYEHGVVGSTIDVTPWLGRRAELALLPAGVGFRHWGLGPGHRTQPAQTARGARTLWEVLSYLGVETGVLGWPGTAPANTLPKYVISDRFFDRDTDPGVALPMEIAERGRLFKVAVDQIDPPLLASFGDNPPAAAIEAVAGDLWRQDLASFLASQAVEGEALTLYLPGLATASLDSFGTFAARHVEGAATPTAVSGSTTLSAYYALLDRFLGELWQRIEGPKLLVVVSAYGVEPAGVAERWADRLRGRPVDDGSFASAPDGLLLLYGEGVRSGSLITEARIVDVMPTLMYAVGLPVASDLNGRVLTEALDREFLASHPLTFLPSYETLRLDGDAE